MSASKSARQTHAHAHAAAHGRRIRGGQPTEGPQWGVRATLAARRYRWLCCSELLEARGVPGCDGRGGVVLAVVPWDAIAAVACSRAVFQHQTPRAVHLGCGRLVVAVAGLLHAAAVESFVNFYIFATHVAFRGPLGFAFAPFLGEGVVGLPPPSTETETATPRAQGCARCTMLVRAAR